MNKLNKELDIKLREYLLSANYSAIDFYWLSARKVTSIEEIQRLTNSLNE